MHRSSNLYIPDLCHSHRRPALAVKRTTMFQEITQTWFGHWSESPRRTYSLLPCPSPLTLSSNIRTCSHSRLHIARSFQDSR